VLPLGELEGKRSTRDRRSLTELEGGRTSEGAARPPAHFNSVPLTDTGHARQHSRSSNPQLSGFVFHLLVPSIILVLLAVGGLLFYRWRRRVRTSQEERRVSLKGRAQAGVGVQVGGQPGFDWVLQMLGDRVSWAPRMGVRDVGFFKNWEGSGQEINRKG
jgi:hypothetical protein